MSSFRKMSPLTVVICLMMEWSKFVDDDGMLA